MSTIYFDFSAIKSGGGAQLALNFLLGATIKIDCKIIISDKFPQKELIPSQLAVLIFRSDIYGRLIDEHIKLKGLVKKGDIIYTFFGPGLPRIEGVKQITGVAYPIVCNYDSPYWFRHSKKVTLPKRIKNYFRSSRLKKASHLIFETEIMRSRFCATYRFPYSKTTVLPPTPTSFLKPSEVTTKNGAINFLFLTGSDFHKNLDLLIDVAKILEKIENKFTRKPKFVVSISKADYLSKFNVSKDATFLKYFDFVGQVPSTEIQTLYDRIEVVCNIADLESFSNNYMEAWLARKPLLLHDTDFSRHICGGSGVFANAYDANELALKVLGFCNKDFDLQHMIEVGDKNLKELPSLSERQKIILKLIELS